MFHLSMILYLLIGSTIQPAPNSYNTLEATNITLTSFLHYITFTISQQKIKSALSLTTIILMFYLIESTPGPAHYHPNIDICTLRSPAYTI